MIFDKVSSIEKYRGISKNLDKAIDVIVSKEYLSKEIGKYEVDGKEVFYMIQDYNSKALEDCFFETHEKYADIQMVITGEEGIGYADLADLEVTTPFNPEKDVEKQKGPAEIMLQMNSENFVFIFPGEAHMPGYGLNGSAYVKKAVFKIKCK